MYVPYESSSNLGRTYGFSRPIIKMHARYVTTLCTYIRKYYPAPVPALSPQNTQSVYGVFGIYYVDYPRRHTRTKKKSVIFDTLTSKVLEDTDR